MVQENSGIVPPSLSTNMEVCVVQYCDFHHPWYTATNYSDQTAALYGA